MNTPEIPYSRLFILGGKGTSEDEWREHFGKFGEVKDVWILRDKRTNEDKGVVYITFAKASMAALAREKMHHQSLPGCKTQLKVLLANDKHEGSVRESQEDDKNLRLFIKVPKTMKVSEIKREFEEHGEIDNVSILRDKTSGDSKGLAYVRYTSAYHAALAVENSDPSFRAIFAARKPPPMPMDMDMGPPYGPGSGPHGMPPHSGGPMDIFSGYPLNGETRLEVTVPSMVTQEQLFRLFDIVPGLDFCNLDVQSGVAYVRYINSQAAAYACDKLNGFEYPPSYRLAVRFGPQRPREPATRDFGSGAHSRSPPMERDRVDTMASDLNKNMSNLLSQPMLQDNIQSLVNSIKQATSVLSQVGVTSGMSTPQSSNAHSSHPMRNDEVRVRYTNVLLPEKQMRMPRDSPVVERVFFVSLPESFSEQVLLDCFVRFGNLIDAFFMPGKNYGFAKFGSKESAQRAIDTLHLQTVCGQHLKVKFADPPKNSDEYDSPNKRPRS